MNHYHGSLYILYNILKQVDITISKNQALQILIIIYGIYCIHCYAKTYIPQMRVIRETRKVTVETIAK